jgi:hypothetical protein
MVVVVTRSVPTNRVDTCRLISVRFGPLCGLKANISGGPRSASSGLMQCSKLQSIRSSRRGARAAASDQRGHHRHFLSAASWSVGLLGRRS